MALLNLSGLGAGYAYLGARVRTVLYLTLTLGLVVVAFATDAAGRPWLWRAVFLALLGWMAFEGWWLARRRGGNASTERRRPALVGAALAVAVFGGYALYGVAAAVTFNGGLAAQSRGDCAAAAQRYDRMTGAYELTLSSKVSAAAENQRQCAAFVEATRSQSRDDFGGAVRQYHDFEKAYPGTVLQPFVTENLKRSYADWGRQMRERRAFDKAIEVYRQFIDEFGDNKEVRNELAVTYFEQAAAFRLKFMEYGPSQPVEPVKGAMDSYLFINREFADTEPAAKVAKEITDTFNAANRLFVEQKWCPAIPVLDYFASLSEKDLPELVGTAHGNRARAMYECGIASYASGQFGEAISQLERLARTYPDFPGRAQGLSVIIAAKVAAQREAPFPPIPAPLGGNTPGSNPVTFYNDSSTEVRVLISGSTAHEFVISPCGTCPEVYSNPDDACKSTAGLPSLTLRLAPGQYFVLTESAGSDGAVPNADTLDVRGGFIHTYCTFTSDRRLPGG